MFVAFEGIDGTGKSSALARVAAALAQEGKTVHATREETSSPSGDLVRRSIRERWDPLATTFLFVADRARHVAELKPRLAAGEFVLCDRFVDSTYAYQGVTLDGVVPDPLTFLRRLHEGWCPRPDRVLLFTADPKAAVARVEGRGAPTPYEKVAFLERVQDAYLRLAKDDSTFTVIDANGPLEDVAARAFAALRSR